MSAQPDITKQLEQIFGAEALQSIKFTQPVATFTESSGAVVEKHLLVTRPNDCRFFPQLQLGATGGAFFA